MRSLFLCVCVLLLLAFATAPLMAQDTGAITGTVKDTTGANIPGADVKITGSAGGISRATTTNGDGDYLAAGLPGGTYDLSISAKGFKTFEAKGVVLRVGQKARLDASLAIGNVSTEVVVQGENLAQVETQSSDLSGVVTGKQVTQLELNGRNYTQLIQLTPGATNQSGADEPGVGLATVAYSVNGGRTEYNNFEVDGGSNLDDGSNTTLITYPSLDAIAEFKVLTSNYGAQYGRNGSGTVEVETKSGTKSFHGDAYEFVRNDDFNARNFFLPSVPKYKKNDYGYTIGGPVYIPGHYNQDKSKTFFFFSEEWRKDIVPGINFNVPVPTIAERGCTDASCSAIGNFGNFNDLCPGADCPVDPTTGNPFPGNMVPIDPNAKPLLAMFPLPNSGPNLFVAAPSQPTNWREELFRIDHNINNNLHATFRYIHDSWNSINAAPLWTNGASYPTIQDQYSQPSTGLIARLTAVVNPTLLNEFVFSYDTNHIVFQNQGAWQRPAGYNVGLFQNGFGGGKLPGIALNGGSFNGIAQDAGYVPNGPVNSNPVYTYRDNLSKIWGKHNVQFGAYFVASQKNELPQFEPSVNGFFTFDTSSSVTTGDAFADLLTGRISSFAQASAQPKYYLRHKMLEPYVQDDWRITPRLTLNLGMRFSLYGTARDNKQQAFNFDPTAYNPATAPVIDKDGSITGNVGALIPGVGNPFDGIVQCGGKGGTIGIPSSLLAIFPAASTAAKSDPGCMSGHLFNPAPRIGFAWDPWGDGKTAIRGGYGIFWEYTNGNEAVATSLEGSPPLALTPTETNIVGYASLAAAAGAQPTFPLTVVSIPQKAQFPYVQQWHFDVQHEFARNTVAVISYVGSKGTHLGRRRDLNQLFPTPLSQNPYKPGEPFDGGATIDPTTGNTVPVHDDCATGMTPSGLVIPGAAAFNASGLPTPGTPGLNLYAACGNNIDGFRPFLGYGDIRRQENAASSIYHAMQASVRKTVGALQLSLAYTWSHSIDDSSSGGDGGFVNSYDFRINRASSNFDQRHVVALSYVYDLPFFTHPGAFHTWLGGWTWSGITTVQTGAPFTVTNGGAAVTPSDNAGVANGTGFGSYPDLVGNPFAGVGSAGNPGFGPFFGNPAAFVAPRGLTFGDAGRNILRNPRQTNFDMALFKHFPVHESMSFEFRAEAFNVFNHTEFGYIGGGGGSAANNSGLNAFSNSSGCYGGSNNSAGDFSCISPNALSPGNLAFLQPNAAHNARILQLALKFIF